MAKTTKTQEENSSEPEKAFDNVIRLDTMIKLRSQGMSVTEIATQTGNSPYYVHQMLREFARYVRDNTVELAEQRIAEQDARCEYLYRQVQKKLDEASLLDIKYYSQLVAAAIKILDRQARLLGLDRTRTAGGANQMEWLDKATPKELEDIAKDYGLKLPRSFTDMTAGRN